MSDKIAMIAGGVCAVLVIIGVIVGVVVATTGGDKSDSEEQTLAGANGNN